MCAVFRYESGEFTPYATHQIALTTEVPPVFSRDGSRVAMVGTNDVLAVWQLEPWRELRRWDGIRSHPRAIVFDPPGRRLFAHRPDFGVVVVDMATGRLNRMPKDRKSRISDIDISPDNRLLAMSHYNGTIVQWACAPGEEPRSVGPVITERTDSWSVAFSPDGGRFAIGLADGNIHL